MAIRIALILLIAITLPTISLQPVVAQGFAIITLETEPSGAGYVRFTTPHGYTLPKTLLQGMEIRVKAYPRGCFEVDRIIISSGSESWVFKDEGIFTLLDYETRVTVLFKGYPQGACPYIPLEIGYHRLKLPSETPFIVPPIIAVPVLLAVLRRRKRRTMNIDNLGLLLRRKYSGRGLFDAIITANACKSVIEGDPELMRRYKSTSVSPVELATVMKLAETDPSLGDGQLVGLGRLASIYGDGIIVYALSRGLVPRSREDAIRTLERLRD